MTVDSVIAIIISIAGVVCTLASFFIGRYTSAKKSGEESGLLKSDIQYIKSRIDDILLVQKESTLTLDKHWEHIARLEESVKQAHKRINEIKNQLDNIRRG